MGNQARNRLRAGWSELPLRSKGLVIIALPLSAVLVGLVCVFLVVQSERRQQESLDHILQMRSELGQLLIDLVNAETGVRGYTLTRRDEFLEPYHTGLTALPNSLARISDLTQQNPNQLAEFDKLQLIARDCAEKMTSIISTAAAQPGLPSPRTTVALLAGKASMDALRREIRRMDQEESRIRVERVAVLSRVRNWSFAAFVGAGLFSLLSGAAAALVFSEGILLRMRLLEENTRRLSEEIPLIPSPFRSDEIGRLEQGIKAASLLLAARKHALVQSQKMETVGKLAGGLAHEFNSILTVIIGQSELLLNDLPQGNRLCNNASEIRRVAERATTLTRQLLASGRKQILQPEILDLNSILAGMESTLLHLLAPNVEVRITLAAGLKAVEADCGQIEQVILNMAMNASGFMPAGGKLSLETTNVSILQESVGRDPELKPGDYVMLAVTDTGTGLSAEIKAHVFEPFYSIQGIGQGTGLGLSASYGIIKQSGGHISVESEPAQGATFKIYLPQVNEQARIPPPRPRSSDLPRGTETILLVEADRALREVAVILLGRLGYTILAAANGIEALNLEQQRTVGHIDLLFTEVVMPHMGGKELSERMRALSPRTRVLFTSGYTENSIVHQGVLHKGVALLQKPFTPSALARKVREVLDQPAAPEPAAAQKPVAPTEITGGTPQ